MAYEPWLYAAGLAVAVLYLPVLYLSVQASGARGDRPRRGREGADVVTCPNCGTENDPGYRYCSHCVEPLPSGPGGATLREAPREWGA